MAPLRAAGQDLDALARAPLGLEALGAVLAVFDYDAQVPLDARVLERQEVEGSVREKFVFTGVRGDRVPGYLAIPTNGEGPFPVILLLHAGAFSKELWWMGESYGGRGLTRELLASGFAVVALDAQYHGERSANIDYLSLRSIYFELEWLSRYRDLLFESIGDYRRLLDYLSSSRPQLDPERIGAAGHSMGGIMSLGLAAADARVRTVVAAVAALAESWLYPISPLNLAPAIGVPVLLMAGSSDPLIAMQDSQALHAALPGPKDLVVYEAGHVLPAESNAVAVEWLARHIR